MLKSKEPKHLPCYAETCPNPAHYFYRPDGESRLGCDYHIGVYDGIQKGSLAAIRERTRSLLDKTMVNSPLHSVDGTIPCNRSGCDQIASHHYKIDNWFLRLCRRHYNDIINAERFISSSTSEPKKDNDIINSPSHYKTDKHEVIEVIEGFKLNYRLGNVIKYVLRAGKKDDRIQDLKKALWYLEREIGESIK